MIVMHGPHQGQTGLGYATQYLAWGLHKIGAEAMLAEGLEAWTVPGTHVVVDQPMMLHPRTDQGKAPWHVFIPFFEFPPRAADEIVPLTIKWPKRKILCCNPEMYDWVYELQTPEFQEGNKNVGLMQLGAFSDRVSELPRVDNSIIVNGKYEPRKGIDIALEALRTLDMQATVQILHPLHTEDDAKAAVTASQGHNLIPFAQSHEDVQALYDVHHVAVFSSCAEGWNMGLTEALGQGCIVVASDISAHRYQYEIMCEYLGEEETDKRFILVPAYEQPMKYHPRWYPAHIYAGHTWLESSSEDIAEGILQALGMPFPEPWEEGQFPLSWEHAARRLLEEIAWTETLTTPSTTPEDESSPST